MKRNDHTIRRPARSTLAAVACGLIGAISISAQFSRPRPSALPPLRITPRMRRRPCLVPESHAGRAGGDPAESRRRPAGSPTHRRLWTLAAHGYSEAEYFVAGTARAYQPAGALSPDGKWAVDCVRHGRLQDADHCPQADRHEYVQWHGRRRVVERDGGTRPRRRAGWSAATVSCTTATSTSASLPKPCRSAAPPKACRPGIPNGTARCLTRAMRTPMTSSPRSHTALRDPSGVNPLAAGISGPGHHGAGKIRTVIAYGDSQSASRLVTYTNALQNRDQVFDGIHHPQPLRRRQQS